MIKTNKNYVFKKGVGAFLLANMTLSFVFGIGFAESSSFAASKPAVSKKASISVGVSKKLSIKAKGFKVKSVSSKSSDTTIAKVKASKKAITVTGITEGKCTITTKVKATKKNKTKTYSLKTSVTVKSGASSENPMPMPTGVGVFAKDNKTLFVRFEKAIPNLSAPQIRIEQTSDLTPVTIAEDGIVSTDDGMTYTITLNDPGLTTDVEYKFSIDAEDYYTKFKYEKQTPVLKFKDGKKKKFSKIAFKPGKKIAKIALSPNSYGLTPTYSLSGFNSLLFSIDESGNLSWAITAKKLPNIKTYYVTVVAETPITDLYNAGKASIDLTVKIK